MLAQGGKAIVYGSNARELTLPFCPMILSFVSLYLSWSYRLPPETMQRTVAGITQLLAADALTHPELAVYPLEEIVAAHERVERGANARYCCAFEDALRRHAPMRHQSRSAEFEVDLPPRLMVILGRASVERAVEDPPRSSSPSIW